MGRINPTVEYLLDMAVRHVNAGLHERASLICQQATQAHPPHAGVLQLMVWLELRQGRFAFAHRLAVQSLALRADHLPTLRLAADAAQAAGAPEQALQAAQRLVELSPDGAEAWFAKALSHQDLRQFDGAAAALREVLRLQPQREDAAVNLGIVLQESGAVDAAMQAYRQAYRLSPETFGRIAHALAAPSSGCLWLDLDDLRTALRDVPA